MPRFIYTAKDNPQHIIQGEIEAETDQLAIQKLNQRGLFPLTVKPADELSTVEGARRVKKLTSRELSLLTGQLANLTESGVGLLTALSMISSQASNSYVRGILLDVSAKVKDGKSLSEGLNTYPKVFSPFYVAVVQSGEASGNLEQALRSLADFLDKEEEFRNAISSALAYPLFVLLVSLATIIVLLTFVIPRLVGIFADMGQLLPLPTRILIGISGSLRSYWWFILILIVGGIFFLRQLYQKPQGKLLLDGIKLKTAILGEVSLKSEISHLMRTLSLLLSSGMPVLSSLEIASSVVNNEVVRNEINKFKEAIANGLSFSHCIGESKLFPPLVANIVSVGEEAGNLEKSLNRIADNYSREVDRTLKNFTRLLEPVIILTMGLVVGFIVISMLLPIFEINILAR